MADWLGRARVTLISAGLASCTPGGEGGVLPCQLYRPHESKRTFDGRVGSVVLFNASGKAAEVKIYHPDGIGDIELRWNVGASRALALTGSDGARLTVGNDWGIQVDRSCVHTLGEAARYRQGEFALQWTGDELRGAP